MKTATCVLFLTAMVAAYAGADEVSALAARHGLGARDLEVRSVSTDEQALSHTRLRQTVRGVPVWGGEAIVHRRRDGAIVAITDDLQTGVRVDTTPILTPAAAVERAVGAEQASGRLLEPPVTDLWILRRNGVDHLAFRVRLRQEDERRGLSLPVVFVDAHTGHVIWRYDNLQTAAGTGRSLYSGTVALNTFYRTTNARYYLEDVAAAVGTFDARQDAARMARFLDADNLWNAAAQRAGVDAQYGAVKVLEYYRKVHGRNGLDGRGGPRYYTSMDGATRLVSSKVHYGIDYNNAFWDGRFMTYGDGDGDMFSPLATLDIAGHEMTHAVTEFTANLTYADEPGALNESMSDVFGALVERYVRGESTLTWRIGEEAYTPDVSGDALRFLNAPHKGDQPDHYSERYRGKEDEGGVHINSGIPNLVFYLLAKGGTHRLGGSMTGIGADPAARIWYRALTAFMTSSTDFAGARKATLNAATALYGATSLQRAAVARAWALCGVGTATAGAVAR